MTAFAWFALSQRRMRAWLASRKSAWGERSRSRPAFLPAKVEKLGTGEWIKLTPAQNLPPGEYAVVEMLSPQEMNLYVWDFGVNHQCAGQPEYLAARAVQAEADGLPIQAYQAQTPYRNVVAATFFNHVHQFVGALHNRVRAGAVMRIGCDSDAGS